MLDKLEAIDIYLFKLIHISGQNAFFDLILPLLREKNTWYPVYVGFIIWCILIFKKKAWIPVVVTIAAVALSDQLSANLIKHLFERPRPCNTAELKELIRHLVPCGSGFSFVSAHAANHFSLAMIFTTLFTATYSRKLWKYIFYFWALLIVYAQVYVGVHFPFDVLIGAMLGLIIGKGAVLLLRKYLLKENHVPG